MTLYCRVQTSGAALQTELLQLILIGGHLFVGTTKPIRFFPCTLVLDLIPKSTKTIQSACIFIAALNKQ